MAEAMIAKKPVIVTDIPAVNSIIQNNVTGLVVPAKDSEALAKAILFLARNPEEARLIAARGYANDKQTLPPGTHGRRNRSGLPEGSWCKKSLI